MKKILIIFMIINLIVAFGVSANSFSEGDNDIIKGKTTYNQNNLVIPPLPGYLNNNKLDLIANYDDKLKSNDIEILKSSKNDNIISLFQQVNENLYLSYLENLTSFGSRLTTTQACEDAGEYIFNEFQKLGLETRYQEWTNNDLYGTNIEATKPGINQSNDEIFIICAHYDSVSGSPGADDDGSGVAAVLVAANIISRFSFNNTIRFVTFSGEEQGLYGSFYYVEEAYNNEDNIVAVLNADMIGFAETENDASKFRVYENDLSEWITDFTIDVSLEYYEFIEIEIIPSGYSWGSDHYRFWEAGYNAIFYAEYNFNDYYHSSQDTIENMNIPYAIKTTKLIVATLAELSGISTSNAPLKPDTPSGETSGKTGLEYSYTTSTIDVDGDMVYYYWLWGDGTNSNWIGPYYSGEVVNASHTWNEKGEYSIKVKSMDENGLESDWSNPLIISMPKTKKYQISTFLDFIQYFFNIIKM